MDFDKLIRFSIGADYAVSKINTDYETGLLCCNGFFYNPHLILKLHYRPRWLPDIHMNKSEKVSLGPYNTKIIHILNICSQLVLSHYYAYN